MPALQQYVERQGEMDDLNCTVQIDRFAGRLTPQAERAIFGIVQEAVGNVRKHAAAEHGWISVSERNGELRVEVRDDGVGFDVEQLNAEYDQRGSLGLLNMRERAESIGGTLSLQSEPGAGSTIALIAPLSPLREAAS
ncbi:MAG: hypothetical protein GWN58_45560 [Anaerolineae bacterium]|nr:hypothetical protein [Anaerolineae bacterium]